MENIGERIKEIRKSQKITLQDLSEKSKLSVGFLSNLERGQTSPTIANLQVICNALNITLNDVLSLPENVSMSAPETSASVVRADERLPLYESESGNLKYQAMTTGTSSLKATCMTLNNTETVQFSPHTLDEMGIIVSGTMELNVAGASYYLYPGDTIIIKANTMHSGRCTSKEACISYWIKAVKN